MAKSGWTDGNWILVCRELKDKPWAKLTHRFALWVHLLLRAAWKEHDTVYRGHKYHLMPGEFPTTMRELAAETGISSETVFRNIVWYKSETMIETKTTGGSTLIRITNWEKHQPSETKPETKVKQQVKHPNETLQKKGPKTEEGSSEEKDLKKNLFSRFDEFWEVYPKKQAKKKALAAWKRGKCDDKFELIMQTLRKFILTSDWTKDAGQYVPLAATWINGERWNDEPRKQQSGPDLTPEAQADLALGDREAEESRRKTVEDNERLRKK